MKTTRLAFVLALAACILASPAALGMAIAPLSEGLKTVGARPHSGGLGTVPAAPGPDSVMPQKEPRRETPFVKMVAPVTTTTNIVLLLPRGFKNLHTTDGRTTFERCNLRGDCDTVTIVAKGGIELQRDLVGQYLDTAATFGCDIDTRERVARLGGKMWKSAAITVGDCETQVGERRSPIAHSVSIYTLTSLRTNIIYSTDHRRPPADVAKALRSLKLYRNGVPQSITLTGLAS